MAHKSSLSTSNCYKKLNDTSMPFKRGLLDHEASFDQRISSQEISTFYQNSNDNLKSIKLDWALLQSNSISDHSEELYFQQTETQRHNLKQNTTLNQRDTKFQIEFIIDSFSEKNQVKLSNLATQRQEGSISERNNIYCNPFSTSSNLNYTRTSGTWRETFNGKLYRDTYNRKLSRAFLNILDVTSELANPNNSKGKQGNEALQYLGSVHRPTKSAIYEANQNKNIESFHKTSEIRKIAANHCEFEIVPEFNHSYEHFERKFFGAEIGPKMNSATENLSVFTDENTLETKMISHSPPNQAYKNSLFSYPSSRCKITSPTETSNIQADDVSAANLTTKKILFKVPCNKLDAPYNKRYLQNNHFHGPVSTEESSKSYKEIRFAWDQKMEEQCLESKENLNDGCISPTNEILDTSPNRANVSSSSFDELERARNSSAYNHLREIYFPKAGELESDEEENSNEIHSQALQPSNDSDHEYNNPLGRLFTIEDEIEETGSTRRSTDYDMSRLSIMQQNINSPENGPKSNKEANFQIESEKIHSTCLNCDSDSEPITLEATCRLVPKLRENIYSFANSPSSSFKIKDVSYLQKINKSSKTFYEEKENYDINQQLPSPKLKNSACKKNFNDTEAPNFKDWQGPQNGSQFWGFKEQRKIWFRSVYHHLKNFRKKNSSSATKSNPISTKPIGNQNHSFKGSKTFKV